MVTEGIHLELFVRTLRLDLRTRSKDEGLSETASCLGSDHTEK